MIVLPFTAPQLKLNRKGDEKATQRSALTLLEVILALGLTVVIVGMIGNLVGMHSHITDSAKRNVETAQLASAIMSLIVEDIRGIQADYLVVTKNDAALEIPPEEEGADESEDEEVTEEELASQVLPVGLYGTNTFLRMDTAKKRRAGRRWINSDSAANDLPANAIGELQTVSYGMDLPASSEQITGALLPGQEWDPSQPLLVRSARDRAISAFFTANLGGDDEHLFAQPIASEVAAIQFRYFDGTAWLTEWDTVEFSGLPLAVEITLLMNPSPEEANNLANLAALESDLTFRRTVQIPAARPLLQEDTL